MDTNVVERLYQTPIQTTADDTDWEAVAAATPFQALAETHTEAKARTTTDQTDITDTVSAFMRASVFDPCKSAAV